MAPEIDWESLRESMVRNQIERRGLTEERLLRALRTIPRHLFVPMEERYRAYIDGPLPIGGGQTISQPYIVAVMTSLLVLQGDGNVLEIGTGSGYQAAILACMTKQVYSVERDAELAARAHEVLCRLGLFNVTIKTGDGSKGWPEHAPYDGILVTAAAPSVPPNLLQQLADGGRLVAPVGGQEGQDLQVWRRSGEMMAFESIFPVSFVPLRGKAGWSEEDWLPKHE